MSAPVTAGPGPSGQQFKCPNCNGAMAFDAAVGALKCQYCGHQMSAAAQPVVQGAFGQAAQALGGAPAHGPREIPLSEGLTRAPKGFGAQVQAVSCKECGATVNLGPNDQTAQCTYCASSMVMPVAADPNLITPESLVPFKVPKERATESFKGWLKGLWFRPNNLHKMAALDQIHGVYVPYWTFDADVHSEWSAERGWHYYETEEYTTTENGETVTRTREVQRTRWEPAWGWRQDHYDDVLVCGSRGLPVNLVEKMTTFDTNQLVHYSPGFLAGWRAESYAVDLPNAWTQGQQKITSQQESRCAGDVGGDTHRALSVSNRYGNETFKHVLLPVWVAAYRYQNKPYRFLVNGQTGEVVGDAPYSFWKIFLAVLFVVACMVTVGIIIWAQNNNDAPSQPTPVYSPAPGYPGAYPPGTPGAYPPPGYAPGYPAQQPGR